MPVTTLSNYIYGTIVVAVGFALMFLGATTAIIVNKGTLDVWTIYSIIFGFIFVCVGIAFGRKKV